MLGDIILSKSGQTIISVIASNCWAFLIINRKKTVSISVRLHTGGVTMVGYLYWLYGLSRKNVLVVPMMLNISLIRVTLSELVYHKALLKWGV